MSFQETYEDKNGTKRTVVAETKEELAEALKAQKAQGPAIYPNINHPVEQGHDLVSFDENANVVLVDGTGNDQDVPEEPAYKEQVANDPRPAETPVPSKAEVSAAKADAKPANEVK